MIAIGRLLSGLAAACLVLSAAGPPAPAQFEYPGYAPSFPTPGPAQGVGPGGGPANWLGGDASFSCPLDAERSYWSFADVYIAAPGVSDRRESANHLQGISTGNSIAIATCRDVGIPAYNGYSTRYNATLKAWQVVLCNERALVEYYGGLRKFDDPLVNSAYIMTGPSAWGPWSAPRVLARYPEMNPKQPAIAGRPRGTDCVAFFTAEQPAFEAGDGQVVFSYTIGSYAQRRYRDAGPMLANTELYDVYSWSAANPFLGR